MPVKKLICFTTLLFATAIGLLSFVYDDDLTTLLVRLGKFTNDAPFEKIHLQTDKPYYSVGEDIWLKAYVVEARENHLSDDSRLLYIDLVDQRDSVRQSLVLPVLNGTAAGNMHLTDSLINAGIYHLYAYTRWMQNFDRDWIFKKDISVVNALSGAVTGNLAYKFVTDKSERSLNTTILFTDDNGQPYAGKQVAYTLQSGGKNISSGKGSTSADGKL